MALGRRGGLVAVALAAAPWLIPVGAQAADVIASAPLARAVTVYRSPARGSGTLALNGLGGFALVTETRTVSLPAGGSRLRFPGVADGIESASAILTGLPAGVLEKNRDAQVLSPGALVAAALGQEVTLERTNRKTGRTISLSGTLRADNAGVVFESKEGIEALRCSGWPETFMFSGTGELSPSPTLSVKVRSPRPLQATVTLSYLAHGFDWAATYSATLSADGRTLDLGAWVTLANGNGVSFPEARVAVVAGRLNRATGQVEPLATGERILASCWPTGRTSDIPEEKPPPKPVLLRISGGGSDDRTYRVAARAMAMPAAAAAPHVEEEQLGDLKLYRVPEAASVNARQMKQVRLLDREAVPVELLHVATLAANAETAVAAQRVLRTRNDSAHHLGLPLPSGRISTFVDHEDVPLLLAEGPLRDLAVNEDFEIRAGEAPDVQVRAINERTVAPEGVEQIPLLPGVLDIRTATETQVSRIEITNPRSTELTFEARLYLPAGTELTRATVTPVLRDGRQVMRVKIPAQGQATIRYQTVRRVSRPVRPR
jgi:hypothetical protein